MKLLIEIIGWTGALSILAAYALISSGRLQVHSRSYHALNIAGAVAFIINSGYHGAFPSAALNVVWMGIGLYSFLRMHAARQGNNS